MPAFLDEILASASEEDLIRCNRNPQCLFDTVQTGDPLIGAATMQFDMSNIEIRNDVG